MEATAEPVHSEPKIAHMEANSGAPDPIDAGDVLVVEKMKEPVLEDGAVYVFHSSAKGTLVARVRWAKGPQTLMHLCRSKGKPFEIKSLEDGLPQFWDVVGRVTHVQKPV